MRITIAHKRAKAEVMESVDRSFNEMLKGVDGIPVRLVLQQKSWKDSVLTFLLNAKLGLLNYPVTGTVEVTDEDLIVDADFGFLNRLLPEQTVRETISNRIKALLN